LKVTSALGEGTTVALEIPHCLGQIGAAT